jgi:hypothetical protein
MCSARWRGPSPGPCLDIGVGTVMSGDGGLRPKRVELLAFAVPALLTLRR